jgi:hypothetical protein
MDILHHMKRLTLGVSVSVFKDHAKILILEARHSYTRIVLLRVRRSLPVYIREQVTHQRRDHKLIQEATMFTCFNIYSLCPVELSAVC